METFFLSLLIFYLAPVNILPIRNGNKALRLHQFYLHLVNILPIRNGNTRSTPRAFFFPAVVNILPIRNGNL